MAQNVSVPTFDLPTSPNVVGVRVIDSTVRLRVPMAMFIKNPLPGHEFLECPAYSFLIEHSSGQKLLFDLALRKDLGSFPPAILTDLQKQSKIPGAGVTIEKDVASILQDEGSIALSDINAIIWRQPCCSHWHLDHSGDPSTFPGSTSLIVGPGFKDTFLPGYPANPEGLILETDYQGRDLHEIDFETHPGATKLGGICAVDYFQDGSFYLLNSPGHAVGHMAALARTTPSTFMLMGADTCHHCGSIRPTQYEPLPDTVSPSPFSNPPFLPGTICPGEILVKIHPQHVRDKPFYDSLSEARGRDVSEGEKSIAKLIDFDAKDDVFVVIAHDSGLLDLIDFFPKKANDWRKNGWKEQSRWRFLSDFKP
ncbi:uncharacterized protein FOBCDRAFT_138711 [Fusarium oxysporum Fo47]|uniref:Metallo-beta-lactamase domain-containing protein n=1 Tax=Fusarium oxysporum Fo47 TaxID=660027 RepID=W9J9X0_FUSOX|nr:uncharacterized protein FOBCDRAFT_138711 [Fusarium oxysporum Fo47]EWZ28666.1 hypothetical protein FOZG_17671 [Fusarium oxysporum Fo47]QKD57125.2 hypothetical protein FOBCDRAFT_138711 [Fusarium oxysporum Fo47]